jgi:hypothetical protein
MRYLKICLALLLLAFGSCVAWAGSSSLRPAALGIPLVTTIELAMTAAQTDVAIVTAAAGTTIIVTGALFDCANANTVDVSVRIGMAQTNTPTTTGVFLSHPGIPPGGGVNRMGGGGMIAIGADGDDVRITSSVPTTGSCRAVITYYTIGS